MSSRSFGQVPCRMWRKKEFKALSEDAKLAVLFFWCGPHSESAGISEVPDRYAEDDLNWPPERWDAARQEAEKAGFIKRDENTETVFVVGYLASNRPTNVGHHAAVRNQIRVAASDSLRAEAEVEYAAVHESSRSAKKSDVSRELLEKIHGRH